MERLLKRLLFIFCIGLFLLQETSCTDEFLREDLEFKEQEENNGDNPDDNDNLIRVVADPGAALATPNCVMIKPGEVAIIPIAKAFAVWEQNQKLFGKKFSSKGDMGAILIWALPYNLTDNENIEIINYEDINKAGIQVRSKAGLTGNAMIALTLNGEIRWSWHLWVTDYNPGKDLQPQQLMTGPNGVEGGKVYRYKNLAGDHIFMDRNLGATSADKSKGKETHGMYYQWGKKDPMPGFAPPNYIPQSLFDVPPEYRKNNLAYSIEHPDELIVSRMNGQDWYSYYSGEHNMDLWDPADRKKTIYDPCPEGWRLPLWGKPLEDKEDKPWFKPSPWYIAEPENQFRRIEDYDGEAYESKVLGFFPGSGRIQDNGELTPGNTTVLQWSASSGNGFYPPEDTRSLILFMDQNAILLDVAWSRADGLTVRCVRDIEKEN